jgi:hypothetical protein
VLLVGMPREMAEHVGLADESELSPELLLWTGNVTRTPSPLPVRERLVYHVSHHQVMGFSEHQIRLSKGVIAKLVQRKELGSAIQADAPAARAAGFAPLSLTPAFVVT